MITGFEKIVEERIRQAQEKGAFDNLPGAGRPLALADDQHIPEDLRLPYKILKNADCLPPEIDLRKEIRNTEQLLTQMPDTVERYATLKKLNYLIMKLNASRQGNARFDVPQHYLAGVADRLTPKRATTRD
ncbi:MAG: molecular chaperone DnaJ [Desulfatitalea sp. BRH_c12]|nr:MAG: molecular chaperone DnaJ [Desulfatitalea sp. BRH_c12]